MSDVDDIAIDIMNQAIWDHYLEKYRELLPKWIENGRKGQWVVLDYDIEKFFNSETEAHNWYKSQPYEKIMLVRVITNEPSEMFYI